MAKGKKINVLAVDDRKENLLAIESILDSTEINLVKATSGNEALGLMFDYDFALVLLDVQMPGMDGFETAELMRGSEKTRHIPIIFITAINKEKKHIFRGYDAGAVDYIFKPFEPDILQSKVNVFIDLYRQRNTLEELTRKLESTISELLASREELKASQEKYRDIFENANEGIFILNNGKIIFHNPKTASILGCNSSEINNKPFLDFIHPGFQHTLLHDHFDKLASDLHDRRTAVKMIRSNSEIRWVEINSVNITWEGEKAVLNFISDISQRKEAEERIKHARKLAEQANRTKSEFLANMSHEIRTPLNGIIGMAELALMGNLDDEQKERIETLKYSGESLLDIINDILDISKIEARKLELDSVQFSLRGVVEKVLRPLSARSATKNVEMIFDIEQNIHDYYTGDPVRLRQILFNLLGNAIKFTEEGEVKLEIQCLEVSKTKSKLTFIISDTGIGIPEEKREHLFKAFSQADSSTSRKFGGTGLGLVISKNLVELMHGQVSFDSRVGVGSTFRFFIELEKSKPIDDKIEIEINEKIRTKRFLIVDDNETNRKILAGLLKNLGVSFETAKNGEDAYRKIVDFSRTLTPIDVVLLDYHMPGMDGLEMAKLISEEQRLLSKPLVILLSSDDVSLQRSKLSDYGISGYLIKPMFKKDLINLLNHLSGDIKAKPTVNAEPDEPVEDNSRRGWNVLLAEDNLINQKIAKGLLEKIGCNVTIVENGRKAVEQFKHGKFDMIFMDIQMPEMDGYEATGIIRELEKTKDVRIPIIAMTAHAMKGDRDKCLSAGMDEYVTKPISINTVLEAMQKFNFNPKS